MQLYSKSSKAIEFIDQFTDQDICVPQKKRKKISHTSLEQHESEKMIHIFG